MKTFVPKPKQDMIPNARVPHSLFLKESRTPGRFFQVGHTGGKIVVLK